MRDLLSGARLDNSVRNRLGGEKVMVGRTLSSLGRLLANYLSQPSRRYMPLATSDPTRLALV